MALACLIVDRLKCPNESYHFIAIFLSFHQNIVEQFVFWWKSDRLLWVTRDPCARTNARQRKTLFKRSERAFLLKLVPIYERLRIFDFKLFRLLIMKLFERDAKISTLKDKIGEIIEHMAQESIIFLILKPNAIN